MKKLGVLLVAALALGAILALDAASTARPAPLAAPRLVAPLAAPPSHRDSRHTDSTPRPPARCPEAAPPRTIDATIQEEVARLSEKLDLDAHERAGIAELTRQSFDALTAELDATPHSNEECERLIARRTDELHARILSILAPAKRSRYREVVGLVEHP